jgi:hypothetical protein
LSKFTGTAGKGELKRYQALVGSLMWPATQTRPDICYSVGLLCRFLANPSDKHIKAVQHCLRYLSGTRKYALSYIANPKGLSKEEFRGASGSADLTGYTDASKRWKQEVETRGGNKRWKQEVETRGGTNKTNTSIFDALVIIADLSVSELQRSAAKTRPNFICSPAKTPPPLVQINWFFS